MADDVLPQANDQSVPRSLALLPVGGPEQRMASGAVFPALAQLAGWPGQLGRNWPSTCMPFGGTGSCRWGSDLS